MTDIWTEIINTLRGTVAPQTFSTWIEPLRPLGLEDGRLTIAVPNRFFIDWFKSNDLISQIESSVVEVVGEPTDIEFVVKKGKALPAQPKKGKNENDWKEKSIKIGLNPRYTFDSFVVGKSNDFAHAASFAVAGDSPRTYNPLFIYGGTGLGKTHLLNAIGNKKLLEKPDLKVCYVHSEQFMNELIQSLANKKMPEFRAKYRLMDILLVDDIQFLAGRERTQEEFFHTFNSLYESNKSIVVTSDKFPKEIPDLEGRLRSRFEWGLIADIQPPDTETKMAILQKKAEIESIVLPIDVSEFLASRVLSNIRELEGSLTRLAAFASLTRTTITLELAQKVLRDSLSETNMNPTVEDIIKSVSSHYRLKINDIKGKRRTKAIAWARQVAMYLSRDMTDSSFPEIGQKIGGKDHSTVMYAYSKVEKLSAEDPDVMTQIESIKSSFGR